MKRHSLLDRGEVKDAMQTSLIWSFMFDPKEGLVAPVTRNWYEILTEI